MYKEPDYADSRLRETIVRHNGTPVYLFYVTNDMIAHVKSDLNSDETTPVHLDELELSAPRLGLVNLRGRVSYLSRKPLRNDYRQGVRPNQIVCLHNRCERTVKRIMECIKGEYPTLQKALEMTIDGWSEVAISRELFIKKRRDVVEVHRSWKGKVGVVEKGSVVFDENKKHLSILLGDYS